MTDEKKNDFDDDRPVTAAPGGADAATDLRPSADAWTDGPSSRGGEYESEPQPAFAEAAATDVAPGEVRTTGGPVAGDAVPEHASTDAPAAESAVEADLADAGSDVRDDDVPEHLVAGDDLSRNDVPGDDASDDLDRASGHGGSAAIDEPSAGTADAAFAGAGFGADAAPATTASAGTGGIPPQYGVGPLSIRETALVGVWALAFIFSFFPIYGRFGAGSSVWGAGIDWVLTIGVPTVAVFLLVLRRFSPQGIRRVGSLGIDQFASVAFSVSATVWLGIIWGALVALAQTRVFVASWVVWVEFILMLAGVVLTVVAPHLPVLGEDFRHRPETPAHRLARAARPVSPRPAAERPAATAGHHGAPAAGHPGAVASPQPAHTGYAAPAVAGQSPYEAAPADAAEPFDANATTVIDQTPAPQAFWALAPDERDVLDESGAPMFRIGPTAWALVIEDRGAVFVVRHEDGRVGYLHETHDITRG